MFWEGRGQRAAGGERREGGVDKGEGSVGRKEGEKKTEWAELQGDNAVSLFSGGGEAGGAG